MIEKTGRLKDYSDKGKKDFKKFTKLHHKITPYDHTSLRKKLQGTYKEYMGYREQAKKLLRKKQNIDDLYYLWDGQQSLRKLKRRRDASQSNVD
jgi:succinate dehydrogenase/fumarate reductase flavoprotein subunit